MAYLVQIAGFAMALWVCVGGSGKLTGHEVALEKPWR